MSTSRIRCLPAASLAAVLVAGTSPAQERTNSALERAVAEIRHVDPDSMTAAEKDAKTEAIADAWDVILDAGEIGRARVKQELAAVRASGEEDIHFQLSAGDLLWRLGGLEEASTIGEIWAGTAVDQRYNYVFYPAFEAAMTQDERALPMLLPLLGDSEGTVFLSDHALTVRWPLTIEFVWGAYGSRGLAALTAVLGQSSDPMTLQSAMTLLGDLGHVEALDAIRSLTNHELEEVRGTALRILGVIGHPDDLDLLVGYLGHDDPHLVFDAAYGLWELEDQRAVPHLIPLLATAEEHVWQEVFAALTHLVNPEVLRAIHAIAEGEYPEEKQAICQDYLDTHLEMLEVSWAEFEAMPAERQEHLVTPLRTEHAGGGSSETANYPWGWELDHQEMLVVLQGWREAGRMGEDTNAWVLPEHIAAAATPADLPLLVDVRASFYRRLSDECLYETAAMEGIIKQVGRSRFRESGAGRSEGRAQPLEPIRVSSTQVDEWIARIRDGEIADPVGQALDRGPDALSALLMSVVTEELETGEAVLRVLREEFLEADTILPALYRTAEGFDAELWPALQRTIADLIPCAARDRVPGLQGLTRTLWAKIRQASSELRVRILNEAIRLNGRAFDSELWVLDPIDELVRNATPDYEFLFPFQGELAIDLLGYRGSEASEALPRLIGLLSDTTDAEMLGVTVDEMSQLEFSSTGMPTNAPEPGSILPLDPVIKAAAARSMIRIAPDDPAVIPAHAYRLLRGDAALRMETAAALRAYGAAGEAALPALLRALDDRDDFVVWEVILTLGELGPAARDAIPALERLRSHPSPMITERARSALRQIRGS